MLDGRSRASTRLVWQKQTQAETRGLREPGERERARERAAISVLLGKLGRKRGLKAPQFRIAQNAQSRKADKYPQAPSPARAKCEEALQLGPSHERVEGKDGGAATERKRGREREREKEL